MGGVCAIIVGGGRSERFGLPGGKLWARIGGVPVIEWTLHRFNEHPDVDHIVLVARETDMDRLRELVRHYPKVVAVVPGGQERWESVLAGLGAMPAEDEWVLVHDGARPAVSSDLITRVIDETKRAGACVPAVRLVDTLKYVDEHGLIVETLPRERQSDGCTLVLNTVQTPQGFRAEILREGYQRHSGAKKPTDDAQVVEAMRQVRVVEGDPDNIKVTYPEDLHRLERILLPGLEIRNGFGYDVHPFAEDRRLVLGGVEIPSPRGLAGHSDADVVLHAITDALLGAGGLDDIGTLFPDTDPAYRDADSTALLAEAWRRVYGRGFRLVNVDVTVLAEAPRIRPYVPAMRERIAKTLETDSERINIKATTSEGMGFVGRGEGIACYAVATLRRLGTP